MNRSIDTTSGVGLFLLTRAQQYVWLRRSDLRGDASTAEPDRIRRFLYWWYTRGVEEYPAFSGQPTKEQYAALVAPAYAASPEAPPISHFLVNVWHERSDLWAAHPLETPAGRRSFAEWLILAAHNDGSIQGLWLDRALREWLMSPDPDLFSVPRLVVRLWKSRPDLQSTFDPGDNWGRQRLVKWFQEYGISEFHLAWLFEEPAPVQDRLPTELEKDAPKQLARPVRDEGVNLIGFASAESGLGEDLRMAARAFAAAGIEFSVFEISAGPGVRHRDRGASHWVSDSMPYGTSILCMPGFESADFYLRFGEAAIAERYVIGYWPWELPRWPTLWNGAFDLVNELWVSSRYTQATFERTAPVPVLHMPIAVDLPLVEPQPRQRFGLREGVFQFLFAFDWHSWPARKNPTGVVEAFRLAFPAGTEPVGLAIKMIGLGSWSAQFSELKAMADADPRISLIAGTLDRSALTALFGCCDAYVSLHRAEGFGRTMAEAMLMGKPVVATNWSGNVDFLDTDSGCPVDFRLRPIDDGEYPYSGGQEWAEPDLRSAAELLRWLAVDSDRGAALGRAARERIVKQYGIAATGARYAERLHAIWRSRRNGSVASARGQDAGRPPGPPYPS